MRSVSRSALPLLAAVLCLLGPTAPSAAAEAAPWAQGTVRTVGKLIWETADGRLGVCSGAVVDAPNGSVVATAAHCVRSRDGADPAGELWFVPAYDHGRDSYRTEGWRVRSRHTPAGWDVTRETAAILPHDYAFLTVERHQGRTIQEAVGANRAAFEPVPEGREVTVFGYPAAAPYDGETLWHCLGTTDVLHEGEARNPNLGGLLLPGCELTAGASGGPWLQDYDPESQSGTLVAVVSVGSGRGDIVGRPFPAEARELLAAAGTE